MRVGFIAFGLLFGWSVIVHPAEAGVAITSTNTRWETAAKLGTVTEPIQLFGALGSSGDARFYQLTVSKAGTLSAAIHVPVWTDPKFHPQLVLYQPDAITAGPAFAMEQPPNTIALVYPTTEEDRQFEAITQISTVKLLQAKLDLPVTGTYYLAVYNADRLGGRFRLTLTPTANEKSAVGVAGWPRCWWISHMWTKPSMTTLFFPLVLIGIIVTIAWVGMRSQRVMQIPKSKKQIPKGKKSK